MSKIIKKPSLINRGQKYYEKNGLKKFVKQSAIYVTWSVLPEDKIKKLIAKNGLLSTFYFYFLKSFHYEMRTILNGQAMDAKEPQSRARMIRLTHGLEKGLTARNRRDLFFEDKIDELISVTQNNIQQSDDPSLDRQLRWVVDVMEMYFSVVSQTERIARANEKYKKLIDKVEYRPRGNKKPLKRKNIKNYRGSFDEFASLAEQRTSTRWFENKSVPRHKIDQAIDVAAQSPSACNKQSYVFKIYDNKDDIMKICNLPLGAHGFKQNIPCIAVITGRQRAYNNVRDKHNVYIDASLAAMTFQYALEAQGLASCCINWHSILKNDIEMSNLLGLDGDETVIMLLAIGYPDKNEKVAYSEKRPLNQIRSYNSLEN